MVPWFSEKNIWDQFIKQGEQDFENFLLHRAKELKKGNLNLAKYTSLQVKLLHGDILMVTGYFADHLFYLCLKIKMAFV